MKTTPAPATTVAFQTDSTKLVSLLALATGAVAMPQAANADIIYSNLNSSPVFVGYSGDAELVVDLPGSAIFGFRRVEFSTTTTFPITTTINYRTVIAGDLGPSATVRIQTNGAGLAVHLPFGAAWDQGNPTPINAAVGWANTYVRNPSSGYTREFLAWSFVDDSPSGGGAIRYGWAEVSLSVGFYPVGPNVTIHGYAYDNTGAKPFMGQTDPVPEPSSTALMVFGALALGSRGLRNWRRNRETLKA